MVVINTISYDLFAFFWSSGKHVDKVARLNFSEIQTKVYVFSKTYKYNWDYAQSQSVNVFNYY